LVANVSLRTGDARSVIKRLRFPLDIKLLCVRWYLTDPLSMRNLEKMIQEPDVFVDHSTIHRWLIELVPVLDEASRKRKRKRGIVELTHMIRKGSVRGSAILHAGGANTDWNRSPEAKLCRLLSLGRPLTRQIQPARQSASATR
jgi:hypothetical protein